MIFGFSKRWKSLVIREMREVERKEVGRVRRFAKLSMGMVIADFH